MRHLILSGRDAALVLLALTAFAWGPGAAPTLSAAEATDIVRVEEDWELVVLEPDYDSNSPQATTLLSSGENTEGDYVTFEINHGSEPEYTPGGLQLQLWKGETHVTNVKNDGNDLLSTPNEHVCWTQAMTLTGGQLVFEIANGSSTTWGNFGNTGQLKTRVATSLTNLNHYSPEVSTHNSGVGFAGNRVQSLKLRKVRVTLSSGQVVEDNNVRTVWEHHEE